MNMFTNTLAEMAKITLGDASCAAPFTPNTLAVVGATSNATRLDVRFSLDFLVGLQLSG